MLELITFLRSEAVLVIGHQVDFEPTDHYIFEP